MKVKIGIIVSLFVCLSLMVAAFSSSSIIQGPGERNLVMVDLNTVEDQSLIRASGARLIEVYPQRALIELDMESEMLLESMGVRISDRLPGRTQLSVKGHRFDITNGMPDFPDELTLSGYEPGEEGLYIVHMLGPVHPLWKATLQYMGVDIVNYVPNYAYEVRMTPEQASQVEKLYFVDWVGVYQPGFKLARDLVPGRVVIRLLDGSSPNTFQSIGAKGDLISSLSVPYFGHNVVADIHRESDLHEIARLNDVYYISPYIEPTLDDEMATQIIGGGLWIWDPDDDPDSAFRGYGDHGSLANQLGYTGSGVVIAVADTGLGDGTIGNAGHLDFNDRVIGGYDFQSKSSAQGEWNDGQSHGTHCAGIAAGNTYLGTGDTVYSNYYSSQGAAPGSDIFVTKIFGNDGWMPSDMGFYDIIQVPKQMAGAYVHTNSYGTGMGAYRGSDEAYDVAARDADGDSPGNHPMIITKSAGNEGSGRGDGNRITSPGNAKNIITVGAVQNYPSGTPDRMADFSSRGWTFDNRVKPDVVAPGQYIYSTMPDGGYGTKSGTSMASPAVAGSAAVLVEWYQGEHGIKPNPSMVKALFINTAYSLQINNGGDNGPHIPNQDEGWGMVNLPDIVYSDVNMILVDETSLLTTGAVDEYEIVYEDDSEPLKITLVWTDKNALNGDNPTLKNNLNLEVESPGGSIYRGNNLVQSWSQPGESTFPVFDTNGDGWDNVNNVENVFIRHDQLEMGVYTVRIIGQNVPADANNDGTANQDYSLVMRNALEPGGVSISIQSPGGGETWTHGSTETIQWNHDGGDSGVDRIHLEYSIDDGGTWSDIVPDLTETDSYPWLIPDQSTFVARVRATLHANDGSSATDTSRQFTIVGSPPAPPVDLRVEHSGSGEVLENGMFVDDYFPWVLVRDLDQGESRWDDAYFTQGGSVYAMAEAVGEGNTAEESSYWQQDVIPIGDTLTVSGAFRRNVDVGSGVGWETRVHHASLEIQVHDSASGWQTVISQEDTSPGDTGWIELGGVDYTPSGYVDSVRVRMHIEAEGDTGPVGGNRGALGELWMDHVKVSVEGMEGTEDNLLTWDASSDDPGTASRYVIYRAESDSGPWDVPLDTVDADGSPSYSYRDPGAGTGDHVIWWYVVRTQDEHDQTDGNEDGVPEPVTELSSFDISLQAGGDADGWNFVSFNLIPTSTSLEAILEHSENGISGMYDRVTYYDASAGRWLSYVPGRADHFNNLRSWDRTMGVWIRMMEGAVLTIEGREPSATTIRLESGWNMVGLPSDSSGHHSLPSQITTVGYYHPSAHHNVAYEDAAGFVFEPGKGYWLYNEADHSVLWTVEY